MSFPAFIIIDQLVDTKFKHIVSDKSREGMPVRFWVSMSINISLSLSLGAVSNSDVGGHGFPFFSVSCSFDDLDFTDFQQLAEAFHEVQPWSSSTSGIINTDTFI